jgi:N-acetylneuraminic acid mutarotase
MRFSASLLPNGKVLVAGGEGGGNYDYLNSTELYDPLTGNWTKGDDMLLSISDHTASVLNNGYVLVTGGCSFDGYNQYATNVSMLYSSSMKAFMSFDGIEIDKHRVKYSW